MRNRFDHFRVRSGALLLFAALCVGAACTPTTVDDGDEGNVGVNPADFPDYRVTGEPNDMFEMPIDVVFSSDGKAQLRGEISTPDDVDVFNLGFVSAGTRIVADMSTPNSDLDGLAALFDAQERLVFDNDDRDFDNQQYDPLIDVVTRYDSDHYYLAVTSYQLEDSSGSYEISISKTTASIPPSRPQNVVLDFDGGTVTIPHDRTYTVEPFDASDISFLFAGDTQEIKSAIVDIVRQRFDGYDITFYVTPDDQVPEGDVSYILFGGSNPTAYGISEGIDHYNFDRCDNSIIFVETFDPSRFGRLVTRDDIAMAIGNVAAHEMGHLLGLNHVSNVLDLMDTTGGARSLLVEQQFMQSALHHSIFPIGNQDAVLLLAQSLGSSN